MSIENFGNCNDGENALTENQLIDKVRQVENEDLTSFTHGNIIENETINKNMNITLSNGEKDTGNNREQEEEGEENNIFMLHNENVNNHNELLLPPAHNRETNSNSSNQSLSHSVSVSRQKSPVVQKRYSITGTTAISGSLFKRDPRGKNVKKSKTPMTKSEDELDKFRKAQGGVCCGFPRRSCCILWSVIGVIVVIAVVCAVSIIFATAPSKSSGGGGGGGGALTVNNEEKMTAESASLVKEKAILPKEEHIKTHYALVGDREADECDIGTHQSPVKIKTENVVNSGLKGQNTFDLIQVLSSYSAVLDGLKLMSEIDRLFIAGFRHHKIQVKIRNFTLPSSSVIDSPLTRFGFDDEFSTFRLDYIDLTWPGIHLIDSAPASDLELHFVFRNVDADDLRRKYIIVAALGKGARNTGWPLDQALVAALDRLSSVNERTTKNATSVDLGKKKKSNLGVDSEASDSEPTLWSIISGESEGTIRKNKANREANDGTNSKANRASSEVNSEENSEAYSAHPGHSAHSAHSAHFRREKDAGSESAKSQGFPFFVYEGSLPNAPCTEGVFWLIYQREFSFSRELKKKLRKFSFPGPKVNVQRGIKRRKPQALNGRPIVSIELLKDLH